MTSLLLSIFSGPTGEELGWRGYLREELARRHPFTRVALIQGVIWTFWHTILWFVDSDFTGWEVLPYMFSNLIVMTCLAYMMNVILEKHPNLVYSILMHFAFNFPYCFLNVDIWFYVVLSVVFLLIAWVFSRIRKGQLNGKEAA
ncbi:MAG: CPBP family intramembrane metalloprotease [Clostridia bacterium]|nr:CPBP family intramembrane metalloprotease [Clostridia bacterium]